MVRKKATMSKTNHKTYLIAEVGQAHEGSLGILHSYIDAIAETGVDAIKFQVHIAEAESSKEEPFRIPFSYEDASRFDYWKRMSFTREQWSEIKAHCEQVGLDFIASAFSIAAVELLESIGTEQYKIGSGEITNLLLLHKVGQIGKPIILSSGMSSFNELDRAVKYLNQFGNELSILQCTTSYPTPPEKIGFNVIKELKSYFPNLSVGLSEHTAHIETGIAAVALGAELLEFHVVFDRRMFGPDSSSSLEINEVRELVRAVRFIEKGLNHPIDKNDLTPYRELKSMFEKSLAVRQNLIAGHRIRIEDLEAKKPAGMGIPSAEFESIIGQSLVQNKSANEFLQYKDLKDYV